MRRASAMSIGGAGVGLPRQLDQPLEVGAHHRVLAGGLGHALEALQLLARLLLDLLGHLRLGDRLLELGDLGRALVALAELLLDRAHLLAQQVLAVASPIDSRVRSSISRETFSTSMRCAEQLEQLVEPRLEVEGLEQRLLLLGADVHQAGDEVGEPRRRRRRLAARATISAGTCGSSCRISSARCLSARARPSISASTCCRLVDVAARARPGTDSPRGTAARGSAAGPARST